MPRTILEERVERGIYRRGERYVARVRSRHGKLVRVTGRTLAEIRRLKADAESAARRGELDRHESKVTIADFFDGWLAAHPIRESTKREYRKSVERHVLPHLGRMEIGRVEPSDVRALVARWQKAGVGVSAQRNALAPLAAMLASAQRDGEIRSNPAAGIRIPKSVTTVTVNDHEKALQDDELARLRSKLSNEQRFMVDFAVQSGLRIGEILELRWRDVSGDVIHVRRAVYEGTVGEPKTRYGRRKVRAGRTMSSALWRRRKASQWPKDDDLVFPSATGGHLLPSNVHRWLKPAARKAGVGWVHPHSLRHTCGSRLIERGVDVVAVSRWLGHSNVSFTLSVYAHQLRELPDIDLLGGDMLAGAADQPQREPLRAVKGA